MNEELDKIANREANFHYLPIEAKQQARLLRLSRDEARQTVNYEFEVVPLEELPQTPYRALSYTWGHARHVSDIQQISIGTQAFSVRRNLFDFLTTATERHEYGLFFIDAICINQLDHAERQAQVREMSRIYRNADEVIAWLGQPDAERSNQVQSLSLTKGMDCGAWTAPQWAGFKYLSYHAFWSRVWIVQEVLLASTMTIWCGTYTFPLALFGGTSLPSSWSRSTLSIAPTGRRSNIECRVSRLSSPAEVIISHRLRRVPRPVSDTLAQGANVGTLEDMISELRTTSTTIETYQSQTPDLLYQAIPKFSKSECTDPRDRLYGLLGILHERSRAQIEPDYTKGESYAYYQALKVGLEELYHQFGPVPGISYPRDRVNSPFVSYYCDVRDAFGMEDEESMIILRQVLEELNLQTRLQDLVLGAQLRQQLVGQDVAIQFQRDLEQLLKHATRIGSDAEAPGSPEAQREGRLFKFHLKQERGIEKLLHWTRSRRRRYGGWLQVDQGYEDLDRSNRPSTS